MNIKLLILPAVAALTGGCSYYGSQEAGPFDPAAFGEANRQAYAAMIINPDPVYEEDMTYSGEIANEAVEAYRAGEVEEPETQTQSGLNTLSSGGGGGT
jgi:type IV pilus biogenesis protein CpaD/CtpE